MAKCQAPRRSSAELSRLPCANWSMRWEPGGRRIGDDDRMPTRRREWRPSSCAAILGQKAENDCETKQAAARVREKHGADAAHKNEPKKHSQLFICFRARQEEKKRQSHVHGHGQEIVVFDERSRRTPDAEIRRRCECRRSGPLTA